MAPGVTQTRTRDALTESQGLAATWVAGEAALRPYLFFRDAAIVGEQRRCSPRSQHPRMPHRTVKQCEDERCRGAPQRAPRAAAEGRPYRIPTNRNGAAPLLPLVRCPHSSEGKAQVRLTIFLLLLCAVVAGYVFFFEREQAPEGKVILTIYPERVTRIELTANPQSKPIVIEKAPRGWKISRPVQARADAEKVRALLDSVKRLESQRQFEASGRRLRSYGLGSSESKLAIYTRDGRRFSLCVGRKTTDRAAAYARFPGGSTVFLVGSSLADDLSKSPQDFRDRRVIAFNRDRVSRIVLKYATTELELRARGREWEIRRPAKAAADEQAVNSLLASLEKMEAVAFVAEQPKDLAQYGLAAPALSLSLWRRGDGSAGQVQFGRKTEGDEVFARRADEKSVFSVKGSDFREVAKGFGDLRSKHVIAFNRDDVSAIELASQGLSITCKRRGKDKWQITSPRRMAADTTSVDDLLFNLSELRAERIADTPTSEMLQALSQPLATVRLEMKRGGPREVALASPPAHPKLYARTDATGPVFVVASDILKSATADLSHWRDKTVFRANRERVVRIRLASKHREIQLRRAKGDKWTIEKPVKAKGEPTPPKATKADKTKVEDMLWVLEDVRADEFIEERPKDLSRYGLQAPRLTVEVQLEGGKTDGLLLGKKTEKGDRIYIKSKSRPEVFLKDSYILDELDKRVEDLRSSH